MTLNPTLHSQVQRLQPQCSLPFGLLESLLAAQPPPVTVHPICPVVRLLVCQRAFQQPSRHLSRFVPSMLLIDPRTRSVRGVASDLFNGQIEAKWRTAGTPPGLST